MDLIIVFISAVISSVASDTVSVTVQHSTVILSDAGCWAYDASKSQANVLEGTTDILTGSAHSRADAKAKCARAAIERGEKIIGLLAGGKCLSWVNDDEYETTDGTGDCVSNGLGGNNSYNAYLLENVPEVSYVNLGCWNDDEKSHTITSLETATEVLTKPYGERTSAILDCAKTSIARKFKVFAVEDGGLCRSSQVAHLNYDDRGRVLGFCPRHGKGGHLINNAYVITRRITGFQVVKNGETLETLEVEEGYSDNRRNETEEKMTSSLDVCEDNPCIVGWCMKESVDDYNCTCPHGFQLDKDTKTCVDVDECEVPELCVGAKSCKNLVGSYICTCHAGYRLNHETRTCVDIDECQSGDNLCRHDAECKNTEGHYSCKCKEFFTGDGITSCYLDSSFARDFAIECQPNRIKLHVPVWFIKMFGRMHLADSNCIGMKKATEWLYMISEDLSTCGNEISVNNSHIFYKNILTNTKYLATGDEIVSGAPVTVDWMCIYPSNDLPTKLMRGKHFIMGAGVLRFGTADINGNYKGPAKLPPYIMVNQGGIIVQTESPGGEPVTDKHGDVVPVVDPDTGDILTGPEGGKKFVPVTDADGLHVLGLGGNIVPMRDSDGNLVTPAPPIYPPGVKPYDSDEGESYFQHGLPKEFDESALPPVIGGQEVAGNPILDPITLSNGTVIVPGLNGSLPDDVKAFLNPSGSDSEEIIVRKEESQKIKLDGGQGSYSVSLWPFTDATYMNVRTKFIYDTREILHLRVLVDTTDTNIAVFVEKCWGTAAIDAGSLPSILLIKDGCAVGGAVQNTVRMISNGEWRTADFQTQVFSFVGYNSTYIHCLVDLCNKKTSKTCKPECKGDTINKRKKRSIFNEKSVGSEETTKLTLGPFVIDAKNRNLGPESINGKFDTSTSAGDIVEPDTQSHTITAAIVFVCVANVMILIAVVACAIYCVRRHRNNAGKAAKINPPSEPSVYAVEEAENTASSPMI